MQTTDKGWSNIKLNKIFVFIFFIFLIILLIAGFNIVSGKARDVKRMLDVRQIQTALTIYQSKYGVFPQTEDRDFLGWEMSFEKNKKEDVFLKILKDEGIVESIIKDPINSDMNFYRYQRFPARSYGCEKAFYILQVMNFEGDVKDHGYGECPEKDFTEEALNGYTLQVFE